MITCNKCDEEFDNREAAESHVINQHADICDQKLYEYIGDSQREACEELLEGEEE